MDITHAIMNRTLTILADGEPVTGYARARLPGADKGGAVGMTRGVEHSKYADHGGAATGRGGRNEKRYKVLPR